MLLAEPLLHEEAPSSGPRRRYVLTCVLLSLVVVPFASRLLCDSSVNQCDLTLQKHALTLASSLLLRSSARLFRLGKHSSFPVQSFTKASARRWLGGQLYQSGKQSFLSTPRSAKAAVDHNSDKRLPVTLLCGFLGAGKTTLLKHILEAKHTDEGAFKCAVIVNDMAELNIDKSLIDKSALIQSDEVIALQNGCVCCTLKSDLVDQITELATRKCFDYMIIETSGVTEPAPIAKLFVECDEDHDHNIHQSEVTLNELAKLDTCVTVLDSVEFFNNFETVQQGTERQILPQLLVEQIEYANVVILNKIDLVSQAQVASISERVSAFNPKAKILNARSCKVDVMDVVNTGSYDSRDFNFNFVETAAAEELPACCVKKTLAGESPCCKRSRTLDSGKSQVLLTSPKLAQTRHESRFGITSFLYRARRPFHPTRFLRHFASEFFVGAYQNRSEEDNDNAYSRDDIWEMMEIDLDNSNSATRYTQNGGNVITLESKGALDAIERQQDEANAKRTLRDEKLGVLFRIKGFVWITSLHDFRLALNQAGNVITINADQSWSVLDAKAYFGTESEKAALRKDWVNPWGDRRQELVFIGNGLKHEAIQELLDLCLLTDEEIANGLDYWKAAFGW